MKPQIIALAPIRAMRRVRAGASADNTPIWMPSDPRFANPHSAYEAMVYPRLDSGFCEAIKACRLRYAANSFSISFVARSSETARISERGTPEERVSIVIKCRKGVGGWNGVKSRTDEKSDGIEDVAQHEL